MAKGPINPDNTLSASELSKLARNVARLLHSRAAFGLTGSAGAHSRRAPGNALSLSWFFAQITGNAADGSSNKYAWSEVYHDDSSGYSGWATVSGGRSGTTTTDPARSLAEIVTGLDPTPNDTVESCTRSVYSMAARWSIGSSLVARGGCQARPANRSAWSCSWTPALIPSGAGSRGTPNGLERHAGYGGH